MCTIFLVRHAHTVVADNGIVAGFSDVALSQLGKNSLIQLKNTMGSLPIDTYYTSDLIRSQQSMKLLTNHTYIVDARLKEINFGDWEGLSWNDVHEQYPDQLRTWSDNWVDQRPPNGETFKQLRDRCNEWLKEQSGKTDQTILAVAHGGSIRALLCAALVLPLHVAMQFDIDHASVTKLVLNNKANRCAFVNRNRFSSV